MRASPAVALGAFVALTLAACSTIPLHTAAAPEAACDAALTSGTLTNHRPNGLALRGTNGAVTVVLWPYGYSTRGFVGSMELVDPTGQAIAREGDFVEIGGGQGANEEFVACAGTIRAVPPPG